MPADLGTFDLTGRNETVRDSHRNLCVYLRSNRHRTDYPAFLAHRLGRDRSAGKTIIRQCLKGPCMRWRERATTAVSQLRALFKRDSNLWTNYWHPANCA